MLELLNVSKRYGTQLAVEDLSFRLNPGDLLGLIGPNGAGKSTTLKMCVGHLNPSSGSVRLDGQDVLEHPLEVRRQVGYVPEYVALYEYLSGAEYLDFVGEVKGLDRTERDRQIEELLEVLELGDERRRLIRTYSQGMRRKAALAAAMLGDPAVLILDESLNGLDPTTSHRLKAHLQRRVKQGCAVLLSSHVLEVLERLCNRVLVMRGGRLIDHCDRNRLESIRKEEGGLERYFLELMREEDQQPEAGPANHDMV